ncbi:MAG: hypothetical protein QXM65_01305 [Candidatus Bathyarchaeia archaeon]
MFKFLRRKSEKAEVVEQAESYKPTFGEAVCFLKAVKGNPYGYYVKEQELPLAKILESQGLIRLVSDSDAVSHVKRVLAIVCDGVFSCEGCKRFSEKEHSYKMPSGAIVNYGLQPYCEIHGFFGNMRDFERGVRCGDWKPKKLLEACR